MTDTKRLRQAIEDSGLKLKSLAKKMELSGYGLQLKIDGKNEFKANEIQVLTEQLGLSNETRDQIFFA